MRYGVHYEHRNGIVDDPEAMFASRVEAEKVAAEVAKCIPLGGTVVRILVTRDGAVLARFQTRASRQRMN